MTYASEIQRLRAERERLAAELRAEGKTFAQIGAVLGVTRQRAYQLAKAGRQT